MKKNSGLGFLGLGILFAVYSLIVLLLIPKSPVFWIAYGCSIVFAAIYAFTLYSGTAQKGTDTFMGLPVLILGSGIVFAQMIVSIIFMLIPKTPVKVEIVIEAVLLAAYLIIILCAQFAKNTIETGEAIQKEKVLFIRTLAIRLEGSVDRCTSDIAKAALTQLVELIRYSDPMSDARLGNIEQDISFRVSSLAADIDVLSEEDIISRCKGISMLMEERNRLCKLYK